MRAAHVAAAAALTILSAAACRPSPTPPPATLEAIAEGYVRVTLQLAQHNPDLVESWRGPEAWKPGARVPVAGLLDRVRALESDVAPLLATTGGADHDRAAYLDAQLQALAVAAERLSGKALTFDEEARRAFGVDPPINVDVAALAAAREDLAKLLPGQGPLADRYAAYRRRLSAAATKVEPLMRAALAACREASDAAIGLPGDEASRFGRGHRVTIRRLRKVSRARSDADRNRSRRRPRRHARVAPRVPRGLSRPPRPVPC